jgi:tetratricopeptide (TPR) repeat protein
LTTPTVPLLLNSTNRKKQAMADRSRTVPTPTPDQRRVAAENFERARQVLQTGNYDYGIQLLLLCCKLDPSSFPFRQSLRKAQKAKYANNLRGSRFAFFSTPRYKAKVKTSKAQGDYVKVLEHAESVFTRNPWDLGTQMDMSEAFEALGLLDLAVYTLDQARQKYPDDATLNRALARLFEKRGDFTKAIGLWQLVQKANPKDVEAAHKAKDLAASETIARGGYAESISGTKDSPVIGRMEEAALEKQDKVSKEASAIHKRIEADPTGPELYVQLAAVYRRQGHLDRARAALIQGQGPTGNHFKLQLELLELDLVPLRVNLEKIDEKLRGLQARPSDDDNSDDEPSAEELAKLRVQLKREIVAREAELYRVKAERFPAETAHRLELGRRLLKLDKIEEAITELQIARRDDRLKGKASLYLGLCFRKRNNWRLAERNFEEALPLLTTTADESTRKEVLYQLATGSAENGELPKAMDLGHELANIDFGYKNIGNLLDEWELRAQDA